MAIIDATNAILGRLASVVAKRALKGEKIDIVNCEKAVVTGPKLYTITYYKQKQKRGHVFHGPDFPKQADRILRRTVRGMIPFRTSHGLEAYKRVMCYVGMPEAFANEKIETIPEVTVAKLTFKKYVRLGEIAKQLGSKQQ